MLDLSLPERVTDYQFYLFFFFRETRLKDIFIYMATNLQGII